MSKTDSPQYYAIPDPLDPKKVSYWYRPDKGANALKPWPPRRSRWGRLNTRDVPINREADPEGWLAFVEGHFARVGLARIDAEDLVTANPGVSAARFAAFTTRCSHCSKTLSDERSKVYGIGPECRTGIDPGRLAAAMEAVRAAHAETLARIEVPTP